jgi:CHAT domain-containing protein/tetratricopeptide (TPR) repeat protein
LRTVARLTERPAPALADLAAAHILRAERAGTPGDLFAALEAAEEAVEASPRNRAALFNRALALHRIGLVEEAARDWREYLAVDSTSRWAADARRHLRLALSVVEPPPAPARKASAEIYAAYAAANPQGGRVLGWCRVLGDWSGALLSGDTTGAEGHLRRAGALAGALERRPGGDASLADAVGAIRAAGTGAKRRLARGHREFAAGCALENDAAYQAALPRFTAAEREAENSPTLRRWARLFRGSAEFHLGDVKSGDSILRQVIGEADVRRHPALAARARLSLASVRIRGERHEAALELATEANRLFARAGERELEGTTFQSMAVAHYFLRDMDAGYRRAGQALERLRPYRASNRLYNSLSTNAHFAAEDGLVHAALRLQNEAVRIAGRTRAPAFIAESRLARSQLRHAVAAEGLSGDDMDAARKAMARLPDANAHGWMTAERQLAEAGTTLRNQPARAAEVLDSAAAYFLGIPAPIRALPAVVGGAEARLWAGDVAGAIERMDTALSILEERRGAIRMEPRRAAVFEAARRMVDRVVMIKLAAGHTAEALAYMDRGRATLAVTGRRGGSDAKGPIAGPEGEVALEYALVGDTLLIWTVEGRRIGFHRATIDTVQLAREVERLRSGMEDAADASELRPMLSRLHEWLIRPVRDRLGGPGTPLVVVADGEIASVPFAALFDAERGRYLIEDRPIRFVPSLNVVRSRRPTQSTGAALLVADPAFEPREHPEELDRLAGALREIRAIEPEYANARLLKEEKATRAALEEWLPKSAVVHYAGHALFDDERPERSRLVLAPDPERKVSGRLSAEELAAMDLRGVRLVVLSACRTVRSGRGRAAGLTGLVGSLLAAGADGAVGTLWDIDDGASLPLMIEFHRAYRRSSDAPRALQAAQIRVLRGTGSAPGSPAVWAAFRYTGR